jgi:tetratricopeptide (TPR) repeat protein
LDRSSVRALAMRTRVLGERLHSEAAGKLLPEIAAHLAQVEAVASRARGGTALRHRLYRVHAETATVAGWTAWLVGREAEAQAYYAQAGATALEAADPEVHAMVLTALAASHSGVPSAGQEGRPARALELLAAAEAAVAKDRTSPYLRAWIAASQAQEHALLGERLAMHRCLDRAATALPERPGPGFFADWDDRLLRAYMGVCYTLAGESKEAVAVLDPLLASVDVTTTQWAVSAEADVAAAYAATGELEHASEILARALGHAADMNLSVDARRVAGYRMRLLPAGLGAPPGVRRLDERLRESGFRLGGLRP